MPQRMAKVQAYPLQMTGIPDRPFDKIAIDLVMEYVKHLPLETNTSSQLLTTLQVGQKHSPYWIHQLDTIVSTFINQYLPVHMCPRYILSDNSTEFKNTLMDQVLKQLGIERIFSAPYHLQSNGKLDVFHKYLKPTLKKLCEKGPIQVG